MNEGAMPPHGGDMTPVGGKPTLRLQASVLGGQRDRRLLTLGAGGDANAQFAMAP